jgi:hypothetical protein
MTSSGRLPAFSPELNSTAETVSTALPRLNPALPVAATDRTRSVTSISYQRAAVPVTANELRVAPPSGWLFHVMPDSDHEVSATPWTDTETLAFAVSLSLP